MSIETLAAVRARRVEVPAGSHRRDRVIAAAVALAAHASVLVVGEAAMLQPPEYGVEVGGGGVEVHLVAAPAPALRPRPQPIEPSAADPMMHAPQPATSPAEPPVGDTWPAPDETTADAAATEAPVVGGATDVVGDGSSPIPGTDPTTFHSTAGALSSGRATYLRNPAPRYPEQARQLGQEGVVLIRAVIDPSGRPSAIELRQSSGFPLLDESALDAVRRWRFHPARRGPLPVESRVDIPIRFRLDDKRLH